MDLLISNHCRSCFLLKFSNLYPKFLGPDRGVCGHRNSPNFSLKSCRGYGSNTKALAGQNQTKRFRKRENTKRRNEGLPLIEQSSDVNDGLAKPISGTEYVEDGNSTNKFSSDALADKTSVMVPSRNAVLQACTVTSGLITSLGFLIRQVSHVASGEGWPVVDCSAAATCKSESYFQAGPSDGQKCNCRNPLLKGSKFLFLVLVIIFFGMILVFHLILHVFLFQ